MDEAVASVPGVLACAARNTRVAADLPLRPPSLGLLSLKGSTLDPGRRWRLCGLRLLSLLRTGLSLAQSLQVARFGAGDLERRRWRTAASADR
ncbi:hypothetical protein, partial [Methylobacterium oxalidis]|uniref:hypothetical protein n=1 Tax=Methylobacterium oxalidis TaxID=944322 RepID=UPI0033158D49